MITAKVTREQLAEWRELYARKKDSLKPDRISGIRLDEYFREKYSPLELNNDEFKKVVFKNAKERDGAAETNIDDIAAYKIDDNILVGIDPASGYFQVECEETEKAIPVWDDLFLARGLSETDLENYVIVGHYVSLLERQTGIGGKI